MIMTKSCHQFDGGHSFCCFLWQCWPFEIIFFFNHLVNVYLLKMFSTNAATTLRRKENYSMVSVSVEEFYL